MSAAAACASFQPKPIEPAVKLADFEARRLDNEDLRKFIEKNLHRLVTPFPPKSWDLDTLTFAALYYQPDLDVARAKWDVARAAVVTAGGRPNPELGSLFQYDANPAGGASPWTLGLDLGVPVETAGRRGYRIARAEALAGAARFRVRDVAWLVRSRVRRDLLGLCAAREREALLDKEVDVRERLARMLEERFSSGMIGPALVTDARIRRDRSRLDREVARQQAAQAYGTLASGLGLPVAALDGVDIDCGFTAGLAGSVPGKTVRQQALLNRPDVLARLAEYAASQSALQIEIARQYPDFRIGPGYTWDQGENKWSIGLSLVLPLFNRNKGPIAEAEARRREAAAVFVALQARVIGEIDRAVAGYGAARKTYETSKDILDAERDRQKTLRFRLRPGEAARFALANAEISLITAKLARLDALVKAQQALGLFEDALRLPLARAVGPAAPAAYETSPRPETGRKP